MEKFVDLSKPISDMEENKTEEKNERTLWQQLVRGFYFVLVGVLCIFILGAILMTSGSSVEVYKPNYELNIVNGAETMKYTCDTFMVNGNQYHLYDTNNVETNIIVIPTNLIVDIKNLKKDSK